MENQSSLEPPEDGTEELLGGYRSEEPLMSGTLRQSNVL